MVSKNKHTITLVQQLQQGKEVAFTSIYDYFAEPLYRNILRMVKDESVAQEILQEVFLKLWVKRHDLDSEKPLKPYLYKIAENLVFRHFNILAQDKRLLAQLLISSIDHITDTEQILIDQEAHDLLQKAIDHLPPQRKRVFTLCKLEGKSYNEVSGILGISNETIKEHIVLANKDIKAYFLSRQNTALFLIGIIFQIKNY